jgi:hypothetical protein
MANIMQSNKMLPLFVVALGALSLYLGLSGKTETFLQGLKGQCRPCEINAKIADAKAMHSGGG